jgi:pyruvate-ferredoxin/flavodoxin oxidoreductase
MMKSQVEEKRAVDCGYWPLYRYNPANEKPFKWECKEPTGDFQEFIRSERRYTALFKTAPQEAEAVFAEAEADAKKRMAFLKSLGDVM